MQLSNDMMIAANEKADTVYNEENPELFKNFAISIAMLVSISLIVQFIIDLFIS